MKSHILIFFSFLGLLLSGCTTLSGYDAKSDFSCSAPEGVLCESMSGVYYNAQSGTLPGQRAFNLRNFDEEENGDKETKKADKNGNGKNGQSVTVASQGTLTVPAFTGTPIRSAPRILRVWIAPWEDSDGDLHDQSYVYMPIDSGKWLIEHTQRRIIESYRPVRPPVSTTVGGEPVPDVSGSPLTKQDVSDVLPFIAQPKDVIGDDDNE